MKRKGLFFGITLVVCLMIFEVFNFATTQYALDDILGNLIIFGIEWAVILTICFCGIDFIGIAKVFAPGPNSTGKQVLFVVWLLAALLNAALTFWAISIAKQDAPQSLWASPLFITSMVLLIRVLIVGSLGTIGDRLFRS